MSTCPQDLPHAGAPTAACTPDAAFPQTKRRGRTREHRTRVAAFTRCPPHESRPPAAPNPLPAHIRASLTAC
eukprot:4548341-Prymnesium_polylepis.2